MQVLSQHSDAKAADTLVVLGASAVGRNQALGITANLRSGAGETAGAAVASISVQVGLALADAIAICKSGIAYRKAGATGARERSIGGRAASIAAAAAVVYIRTEIDTEGITCVTLGKPDLTALASVTLTGLAPPERAPAGVAHASATPAVRIVKIEVGEIDAGTITHRSCSNCSCVTGVCIRRFMHLVFDDKI